MVYGLVNTADAAIDHSSLKDLSTELFHQVPKNLDEALLVIEYTRHLVLWRAGLIEPKVVEFEGNVVTLARSCLRDL